MTAPEIAIETIAAGGDGVGRAHGLVVFVPRTAPGDVAEVTWRTQGRFARGVLRRLVTPSPVRVEPRCPHFVNDRCGGCQLQHLAYDAQLDAKGRIVRDALERIGKRRVPVPAVQPSPAPWRYRRKLTLALRRRGGGWIAGLHPYDAPGRVFPLRDCPITDDRVVAVWREVLGAASELPRADELRGAVRLDDAGATFVLEGGSRWSGARAFFTRTPSVRALWWQREGGERVLLHERRAAGGEHDAEVPGASFAQVNAAVAAELRAYVTERVLAYAPRSVVDAYAGLGDLAASLATGERAVTAIESDAAAAAWCAGRLPAGSRTITARVEDALPSALPADVVVLNPPRGGVHERVTGVLQSTEPAPRAVMYVSCNPATLARDLTRMPRWRIASLRAFDMFPQTAHVETVCELVPEAA